ncbi:hypothetical protein ACDN41_12120 [Priestia aryabhattai]|uniref:hypothetical protein n=1 Tax=Priestia aryabhattai TaxID=412384 RepID=UPI0035321506
MKIFDEVISDLKRKGITEKQITSALSNLIEKECSNFGEFKDTDRGFKEGVSDLVNRYDNALRNLQD